MHLIRDFIAFQCESHRFCHFFLCAVDFSALVYYGCAVYNCLIQGSSFERLKCVNPAAIFDVMTVGLRDIAAYLFDVYAVFRFDSFTERFSFQTSNLSIKKVEI